MELLLTLSTTPPRIEFMEPHRLRVGKLSQLPPSNSRNPLIDYPPLEIGSEKRNPHRLPPLSNSRNLIDYPPPSKSGRNGNCPPQIQFLDPPLAPSLRASGFTLSFQILNLGKLYFISSYATVCFYHSLYRRYQYIY